MFKKPPETVLYKDTSNKPQVQNLLSVTPSPASSLPPSTRQLALATQLKSLWADYLTMLGIEAKYPTFRYQHDTSHPEDLDYTVSSSR